MAGELYCLAPPAARGVCSWLSGTSRSEGVLPMTLAEAAAAPIALASWTSYVLGVVAMGDSVFADAEFV